MNNITKSVKPLRTCYTFAVALLCLAVMAWTGIAVAQLPAPGTAWQFDVTGFIQAATIGGANCGGAPTTGALACGTITVNGHVITVPSNTIVMLPANQLTWAELWTLAPAPYAGTAYSGLAMADVPAPLTTYEAHVVGNVLPGATPGSGVYIAGLVDISQHALNSGAGYVTAINSVPTSLLEAVPAAGGFEIELQIATGDPANPVTKVRINDPLLVGGTTGRYTVGQSPDKRFTSDPDNVTVASGTGFPMCLYGADNVNCPQLNRPTVIGPPVAFAGSFTTVTGNCTTNPCTLDANGLPIRILPGGGWPDATQMAPIEVGDYITFSGNLVLDCNVAACNGGPTAMPIAGFPATLGVPTAGATYISAHTLNDNIAIFTAPRTVADPAPKDPAYATIEVSLIGTGGLTILGATEAVIRTRFEGFSTDPSRQMRMWGIDVPQPPGSDRDYGSIGVDPGPPTGAVKGRWRFRPPCLAFGSVPTKLDKQCIMNLSGTFLPPTRELRSSIETPTCPAGGVDPILGIACPALGSAPVPADRTALANGLIPGQYHAPIQEYIFVENIPGTPVPPSDFNSVPFLAQGGYTSTLGTTATGPLNPWPGTTVPQPVCTPPTANAGGPYQVSSGGTVTLFGTAGGTSASFAWSAPLLGTLSPLTGSLNPIFTAPTGITVQTTTSTTLTVTACGTTATSTANITINPLTVPTISYTPPDPVVAVASGTPVSITATGTDPTGLLKVDVTWTQTNVGAPGVPTVVNPTGAGGSPVGTLLCKGTVVGGPTSCLLSFTVTLPLGSPSVTINLAAQSFDANGASLPDTTTVTINPPSSSISITSAEYRTGKQRLIINATENLISPTLNLFVQPYVTKYTNGTPGPIYYPCGAGNPTNCPAAQFTNNGAGLYILDIVGPPAPACNPTDNLVYATPCTLFPLDVKASDGGDSGLFRLTRIRQ